MTSQRVYEIRPRKDRRGVDLISDALPFGALWYAGLMPLRMQSATRRIAGPTSSVSVFCTLVARIKPQRERPKHTP
jgi:hypothetical protein